MTMNPLAKPSVFSQLLFTYPTLRSMVSISERSQYNSKKPRKKTKLGNATINMVGLGDPMVGVTRPDSHLVNQITIRPKGTTVIRSRELDWQGQVSQISFLTVNHKKGKVIMRNAQHMLHQKPKVPLNLGVSLSMQPVIRCVAFFKGSKIKEN